MYSIIHKCTNLSLPPAPAIQALLIFCTISMFAMAFSWQATAVVFGESHAVALIVLMLFVALVNSTSNVLFMPYMITFHPVYLTAYFVGMGLSSLIPSIVSLAQGKKRSPMFSKNGRPLFQLIKVLFRHIKVRMRAFQRDRSRHQGRHPGPLRGARVLPRYVGVDVSDSGDLSFLALVSSLGRQGWDHRQRRYASA